MTLSEKLTISDSGCKYRLCAVGIPIYLDPNFPGLTVHDAYFQMEIKDKDHRIAQLEVELNEARRSVQKKDNEISKLHREIHKMQVSDLSWSQVSVEVTTCEMSFLSRSRVGEKSIAGTVSNYMCIFAQVFTRDLNSQKGTLFVVGGRVVLQLRTLYVPEGPEQSLARIQGLCRRGNMSPGFGSRTRRALVPSGGRSEGLGINGRDFGPRIVPSLNAKTLW